MNKLHPCPICDQECVDVYKSVLDGWLLEEEGWRCPTNHYFYTYSYGTTATGVGDREFTSYYNNKSARLHRLWKLIEKAIQKEKEQYAQETQG